MTRDQAKAKLVELGVDEPTEKQISDFLDSITNETKAEKEKAEKLKEKADKADELQSQLDTIQNQNLSENEKAKKENEKLQQQIAELTTNSLKSEAKAILKGAGLEDADIDVLLPGMIADTLENTQARANAYVTTVNKVRENAIKEKEKNDLDGTRTPGGVTPPDETKTDAEKFAESYGKAASETAKASESIVSSYLN